MPRIGHRFAADRPPLPLRFCRVFLSPLFTVFSACRCAPQIISAKQTLGSCCDAARGSLHPAADRCECYKRIYFFHALLPYAVMHTYDVHRPSMRISQQKSQARPPPSGYTEKWAGECYAVFFRGSIRLDCSAGYHRVGQNGENRKTEKKKTRKEKKQFPKTVAKPGERHKENRRRRTLWRPGRVAQKQKATETSGLAPVELPRGKRRQRLSPSLSPLGRRKVCC